jgi:DNA-binding transcriptional LysR family regulator
MAVRFSLEAGPGHVTLDLMRSYYFPVCSPQFAAAHRLNPDTHDLTGVPLFVLQEVTTDPAWLGWAEWMTRFNVIQRDAPAGQRTAGRATATSGAGLVLIGLTEALNDLASGRLVAPLGPRSVQPSSYRYRLIWPAARSLTRAMRAFRDWIADERDRYVDEASKLLGVAID